MIPVHLPGRASARVSCIKISRGCINWPSKGKSGSVINNNKIVDLALIKLLKNPLKSQTKTYVDKFIKLEKKVNSSIIEIHNRPSYVKIISSQINKRVISLYFHNDPLSLRGSITKDQRTYILEKASSIIFVSEWTRNRFFKDIHYLKNNSRTYVVYPSVNKTKFNLL